MRATEGMVARVRSQRHRGQRNTLCFGHVQQLRFPSIICLKSVHFSSSQNHIYFICALGKVIKYVLRHPIEIFLLDRSSPNIDLHVCSTSRQWPDVASLYDDLKPYAMQGKARYLCRFCLKQMRNLSFEVALTDPFPSSRFGRSENFWCSCGFLVLPYVHKNT